MIRLQTSGGRKSRLLFTLLLFMSFSSCFGQEPEPGYAVFNSETGTLTFQCDTPTGTYYSTDNTGTSFPGWYDIRASIKKVVFDSSFDKARPKSCYYWFGDCKNLTEIDGIEYLNTSNVTYMNSMFKGCSRLTSLNLSNFNTENVTSMGAMFSGCSGLTSLTFGENFTAANVTNMQSMFCGCSGLTSLNLSNFNTEKVTDMHWMFYGCSGLTNLGVSNFNTANVTDMNSMFLNCSGLSNLVVSNFNTANVTSMGAMFSGCSGLKSLDVTHFKTEKVTDMHSMFSGCSGLTSLTFGENFTAANVTNMSGMFYNCSGLTSLNLSNFNTANVTDMSSMFFWCSSLTSLTFGEYFTTENVTDMNSMFNGCSGLTSLNLSNFNTEKVTDMNRMFESCSSLTSLDLSKFKTANVTNMSVMFQSCSSLTSLNLSNFNTAKVTDMRYMFNFCSSLTSLTFGEYFTTANVTDMTCMFESCSSLTSLDVSNFNTEKVTGMSGMFVGCSGLTNLDVSKFNTAKVTDMNSMFYGCSGLTSLTFGEDFSTAKVGRYRGKVFYGCSKLRYIDFYASNNVDAIKSVDRNNEDDIFYEVPQTTVIYLPKGSQDVTNVRNVVYSYGGDETDLRCPNYYSEDKVDIELPREFKTTKAEYSRTMKAATQYGTVILPYEFTTNKSVQAYLLRDEHTGTMWYEEEESVPAHTPFFYSKKTASDTNVNFNKTVDNYGITVEATRTTSKAEGGKPYDAASGMDGWTTKGYYITEEIDATPASPTTNTFYIAGDKFWRAIGTLKMYPHRVTYQGQWQYDPNATEAPAMLNIITMGADDLPSEVSTAIEAAHLRSLQQNARDIYDAQGRRQSELKSGLNIVRMADGTTVKIVKR